MPGWEPERMAKIKDLFAMYKDIDDEKLFENLKYFLLLGLGAEKSH